MRHVTLILRGSAGPEEVAIEIDGARCAFTRRGETVRAEATRLPDGRISLLLDDGRQLCGRVRPSAEGEVEVSSSSGCRRVALAEPLRDRLAHEAHPGSDGVRDEEIRALMPGRVVEVAVAAGERVAAGGLLLVLEAMKMQNEIRSLRGGLVLRVDVESGRTVDRGAPLAVVRFEEPAGA
jgi:biotin carboxyl carrier protein